MPEERLAFFPRGSIVCQDIPQEVQPYFYTLPIDTRRYQYVSVGLCIDMPQWGPNADVTITPQISNGGGPWDDTTPTFTSPFSLPYYGVIKIEKIASMMRFKILIRDTTIPPNNYDFAITMSLIGTGHYDEGVFREKPIWPLRSVLSAPPAWQPKTIYSEPFITQGFTEMVCALRCDLPIIGGLFQSPAGNGEIETFIQTSNDGVNYERATGGTFTTLYASGTSYPFHEILKVSELGKYARCEFELRSEDEVQTFPVGGTLDVRAVLRS